MTVPGADDGEAITVDLVRGTPTAQELAALIAVVTESYAQESASAVVDEVSGRSVWERNARSLRQPLRRDLGWRGYSG